jgi:hypothetical protein
LHKPEITLPAISTTFATGPYAHGFVTLTSRRVHQLPCVATVSGATCGKAQVMGDRRSGSTSTVTGMLTVAF